MASKTTLNLTNLEALGAQRLAEIVLDMAMGDANAKRRLRMEIAGEDSPTKLILAIRKRLNVMSASDRYIGWRALKSFLADLEAQRGFISRLSPFSDSDALELAWHLLSLGNSVMERTTDPSGDVLAVFQKAADDIATIANAAVHLPETFIADLCEAVKTNYYGQADGLIGAVGARLGTDGLARLDVRLHAEPPRATDDEVQERRISRWVRGRTLETEVVARRDAEEMVWRADIELADALGDVERYIALQPDPTTTQASLDIASRLVAAGRDEEAIAWLDRAELRTQDLPEGWQATRLLALEGLGRADAAQALRLLMFKTNLNAAVLRDYLKRLPDFEDVEAEEEALTWAGRSSDADRALQFLVTWPALDRAATLVVDRIEELDSTDHVALQAAAEKMAPRYPLAAIMLLRQAVEDILKRHVSAEFSAAGHLLADITRLSAHISDWAGVPDDDAFQSSLKKRFGAVSPLWRAAA